LKPPPTQSVRQKRYVGMDDSAMEMM
jgi:hypothetical protein